MAEKGKGILAAARERLRGSGFDKPVSTPTPAPVVGDVRLPSLQLLKQQTL